MERTKASQLTKGLVVVAIGLILLAGQLDVRWAWDFGRLWPIVFFVLALGRLLGGREGRRGGIWFLFLGVMFLMHTYDIFHLHRSWPLFIVAGGVSLMFAERRDGEGGSASSALEPQGSTPTSQTGRLP